MGDLNAKHPVWNRWLTMARGLLLHDYTNRNVCFIYGLDSSATVPYQHNSTLDFLDIVVAKDFVLPVHLTVWSALSSDDLPVLINTTCQTSFQNPLEHPDFMQIDW
jgi:hypothetical protein